MGIESRGPVPPSNFTAGRDGGAVELIIDHWTVVMYEGAVRRFHNPTSRLSAHYVIGQDGRIAQLVSEDDAAYHSGSFAVNLRSIGIEHEAGPRSAADRLRRVRAAAPRDREPLRLALEVGPTVLPHRAIVPTECPGTLDLERIVREATRRTTCSPKKTAESSTASISISRRTSRWSGRRVYSAGSRRPSAASSPTRT